MNKYFELALSAFLVLSLSVSCQKELATTDCPAEGEIVLQVGDGSIDMGVTTKASEINSVPSSLYISRTTGTWKSETTKNASASKSVSSGKINTGWYQTATATSYNYYVSNNAINFAAGGSTISASNTVDVIAGCTQGATSSTTPSVTLDHVFARTATLTCNAQDGYAVSNVTWKIQSKSGGTGGTAGTYNIATKSWSGVTALSSTSFTSSSDLYLTPGAYTVTVSYTISRGDWTETTSKSGDVTLVAGKKNSITCTVGGNASQIVLSVSLTAWGTNSCNLTFN